MTAKDLNFSFDSELAHTAPPAEAATAPKVTALPTASRQPKRNMARSRQGIATGLIALINMAFLVLAAFWLSGNAYQVGLKAPAPTEAPNNTVAANADMERSLAEALVRISGLQTALQEQSQLLVALQAQIGQLNEPSAAQPNAESATPAAPSEPAAAQWQIHVGAFESAERASQLRRELSAQGFSPTINRESVGAQTTYRLVLTGFSSPEAADQEVQRLMNQTDLSGLWVGKID